MAYYFFHHPLESRDGVPGRYAFAANGPMADANAGRVASFRIPVDGFSEEIPGPNIDPCPFAHPVPVVHSFCRIDRRGGKYYVAGTNQLLSQLIVPGDTVIYGHLTTRHGMPLALYVCPSAEAQSD